MFRRELIFVLAVVAAFLIAGFGSEALAQVVIKLDPSVTKPTTTTSTDPQSGNTIEKTVDPIQKGAGDESQKTTTVEKDKDGNLVKKVEKTEKIKKGAPEVGTVTENTKTYKKGEKDEAKPEVERETSTDYERFPGAQHWSPDRETTTNKKWHEDPRYVEKQGRVRLVFEKGQIKEGTRIVTKYSGKDDKKGTKTKETYDPVKKQWSSPEPYEDEDDKKSDEKKKS